MAFTLQVDCPLTGHSRRVEQFVAVFGGPSHPTAYVDPCNTNAGAGMARKERKLTSAELAHIAGRMVAAAVIGWSYLALVIMVDFGGWGSWLRSTLWGPVLKAELFAVFGVAFGAVGAHIGYCNVMGSAVRTQRAKIAERRDAMRRWERY
jgi:hypothetical protein